MLLHADGDSDWLRRWLSISRVLLCQALVNSGDGEPGGFGNADLAASALVRFDLADNGLDVGSLAVLARPVNRGLETIALVPDIDLGFFRRGAVLVNELVVELLVDRVPIRRVVVELDENIIGAEGCVLVFECESVVPC